MELRADLMTSLAEAEATLKRAGFVKHPKRGVVKKLVGTTEGASFWSKHFTGLVNIYGERYTKVYSVLLGNKGYAHNPYGWIKVHAYNSAEEIQPDGYITWEIAHNALNPKESSNESLA